MRRAMAGLAVVLFCGLTLVGCKNPQLPADDPDPSGIQWSTVSCSHFYFQGEDVESCSDADGTPVQPSTAHDFGI